MRHNSQRELLRSSRETIFTWLPHEGRRWRKTFFFSYVSCAYACSWDKDKNCPVCATNVIQKVVLQCWNLQDTPLLPFSVVEIKDNPPSSRLNGRREFFFTWPPYQGSMWQKVIIYVLFQTHIYAYGTRIKIAQPTVRPASILQQPQRL